MIDVLPADEEADVSGHAVFFQSLRFLKTMCSDPVSSNSFFYCSNNKINAIGKKIVIVRFCYLKSFHWSKVLFSSKKHF